MMGDAPHGKPHREAVRPRRAHGPTMTARFLLPALAAALLPIGCGGGSDGAGPSGGPFATVADDGAGAAGGGGGGCAYILAGSVTSPTRLTDTPADCDYLLADVLRVRSLLEIDPGTVIRAEANAAVLVEGGEILAVGDEAGRITLEGTSRAPGWWQGILVQSGGGARLGHVDLRDAGQTCFTTPLGCREGALIVDDAPFALVDSTISNSHVGALELVDGVTVEAFARNRFHGNRLAPVSLRPALVAGLDPGSDYAGGDDPNGVPFVEVLQGAQEAGGEFVWQALNVPYRIGGYVSIEGGTAVLGAGARVVFGEAAWITVKGNGTLAARGTAERPVELRGEVERPGWWDGIKLVDSDSTLNRFEHAVIRHSGNEENLAAAGAAFHLESSSIALESVTFTENAGWIVICDPFEGGLSDLTGSDNVLTDYSHVRADQASAAFGNGRDTIDPDCVMDP